MGKKKSPEMAMPSQSSHDYETEGHMRTLMDAEAIKQDPAKMRKVHKLAGRHKKSIRAIQRMPRSIEDLKDMRDDAFAKSDEGPAEEAQDKKEM